MVGEGDGIDAIYQALTVADIQAALDAFKPVYDETEGYDGYVSLEVSPYLAHNTEGSLAEGKKLWSLLGRPNAMIKIPGTPEGLPAIEELLFAGVNVNVTLLFSVEAYTAVAHTYIKALKRRVDAGLPIDRIASVASFFISRIDTEADKRIEAKIAETTDPATKAKLQAALGKVAIANGKNAYKPSSRTCSTAPDSPPRGQGGQGPARPLGLGRHQEQELPRHALHRRPDRPRDRQHHAPRRVRRLQGPRQGDANPGRGDARGQGLHRLARRPGRRPRLDHRQAPRRRRQGLRGLVRRAVRRHPRQAGQDPQDPPDRPDRGLQRGILGPDPADAWPASRRTTRSSGCGPRTPPTGSPTPPPRRSSATPWAGSRVPDLVKAHVGEVEQFAAEVAKAPASSTSSSWGWAGRASASRS